jgi:short-subunit dehydrogenase
MRSFDGKKVVITGAASGIGRALAVQLANQGATLALLDKHREGLAETRALCPGSAPFIYDVDVSNHDGMEAVAAKVVHDMTEVDVLINNAGVSSSGNIHDLTEATLRWTMDINFWGTVHGTRAFLPVLLSRPESALVNVSSVYGLIGVPEQAAYCASKFAVRGFTEAVRQDLRGTGVTVTLVFPGGIRTAIVKSSRSDSKLSTEQAALLRQAFEASLHTSADQAARAILAGIRKRAARVLIGRDARAIDLLARYLPGSYDGAVARAADKLRKSVARLSRPGEGNTN